METSKKKGACLGVGSASSKQVIGHAFVRLTIDMITQFPDKTPHAVLRRLKTPLWDDC
jgi:hypothetical protein